MALSIKTCTHVDENEKRCKRRQKQKEREAKRTQRENQGLKGHYIAVDEHREPYGYGKGAWKQELTRLCRGLDPSVMDIRWQPEADMKLLRKRLKDNFEYSASISKAYIRSLAGRNVTQRRNKIINSMVDEAPCPSGMDAHVWRRLDRIRQNPRREELSQLMRYANSCRSNVGRTGPKGVSGVRDDLREKLGREPDPEELEEELRRDKGYGGRSKKKTRTRELIPSKSLAEDKNIQQSEEEGNSDAIVIAELLKEGNVIPSEGRTVSTDKEYMRSLDDQIAELLAKKKRLEEGVVLTAVAAESLPDEGTEPNIQGVEGGSSNPATREIPQAEAEKTTEWNEQVGVDTVVAPSRGRKRKPRRR